MAVCHRTKEADQESTTRERDAHYNNPVANTASTCSFCRREVLRPMTGLIGSANAIRSVKMFKAALAMARWYLLMHFPGTSGFKIFRRGLHENATARTDAMWKVTMNEIMNQDNHFMYLVDLKTRR